MSRSKTVGALAFTCSLLLLGLGSTWALGSVGWSATWLSYVVVDGVVAWLAVLIGVLLGRLTYGAVAISSLCVQVALVVASVSLLATIAYRSGQPAHWLRLVHVLVTPAAVAYGVVGIVSAVAGLFVVRRVAPRLALRS